MGARTAGYDDLGADGNHEEGGVDSYQKEDPKTERPKPSGGSGSGRLGGTPRVDSFQPSRTSPLSHHGVTRRLGSAALPADEALTLLKAELDNGEVLIEKLKPRMAVLERACAIQARPNDVTRLCAGVGAGEANFTRQVALALQDSAQWLRQVQVALYQWEQARGGVVAAREAYEEAMRLEGRARDAHVEATCHVEKLRGQLYPLVNLPTVFRDHPLIAQLIPIPKLPTAPAPEAPLPPGQGALTPPGPSSTPAGAAHIDPDEAVDQLLSSFKAVTGNLRHKLIGWLGGAAKPPQG
ncbi:MAG: hypothetical protein VKQ33_08040 [Candidatus Sericytochromatia bacterium]|nr:hypothetical protein [Candidatus Sericytochromatia bacterium]